MDWKLISAVSISAAALVAMTGCGSGGGSNVGDCNVVPAWTSVKAPMKNTDNVQNAMGVLYNLGRGGSSFYGAKSISVDNEDQKTGLQKLADTFDIFQNNGLAKIRSISARTMPGSSTEDENCSVSGTRTVTYKEGSDDNESEGYTQTIYKFHNCVEYEGFLDDLSSELGGSFFVSEDGESPTNDTYTFNGEISAKNYSGNDGNYSWEGYYLNADGLTIKMEDNESLDNGELKATMYAQVEERSKTEKDESVRKLSGENKPSEIDSLASDGCMSFVENDDDGNNSTIKTADIHLQAVDFNATLERYAAAVPAYVNNSESYTATINGYFGLSGNVAGNLIAGLSNAQPNDLGAYAIYGKKFEITERNMDVDANESNVTVSGIFGTPCMGGIVTYNGTVHSNSEYKSLDGNDSVLPSSGSILVEGDGNATVNFHVNDENKTYAVVNVGDVNKTYGSGDALTEGNCSSLMKGAINLFNGYYD